MMNIKISHVSKTIKNNPVIKDISMELQSGAVYGFKGINGSGKTMLMRLISGLIRPSQGEISMNGKILGKDISFPNSIGVFLENPAFLDAYSGFNNLKLLTSILLIFMINSPLVSFSQKQTALCIFRYLKAKLCIDQ